MIKMYKNENVGNNTSR